MNYDFTFNNAPDAANGEFSTWANLETAIEAVTENVNDAGGNPQPTRVFNVTIAGGTMTIEDNIPRDIETQEPLHVSQIQSLTEARYCKCQMRIVMPLILCCTASWTNRNTTNTDGAGNNNLG